VALDEPVSVALDEPVPVALDEPVAVALAAASAVSATATRRESGGIAACSGRIFEWTSTRAAICGRSHGVGRSTQIVKAINSIVKARRGEARQGDLSGCQVATTAQGGHECPPEEPPLQLCKLQVVGDTRA